MKEVERRLHSVSLLVTLLVVGLLLCPVLYVLSSGPALLITFKTGLFGTYWNTIYKPLTYARDVIPGFHPAFQAYLDAWTD